MLCDKLVVVGIAMQDESAVTPLIPTTPSKLSPPSRLSFIKSRRGIIILLCVLVVCIVIGIVVYFLVKPKDAGVEPLNRSTQIIENSVEDVKTYPKFEFTYQQPETIPQVNSQANSYLLKTTFTESDVLSLGTKFGFDKVEKDTSTSASFSNSNNITATRFLVFDKITGSFQYEDASSSIKINNANIKVGAKSFLTSLGMASDFIECDITYGNRLVSDRQFVECHLSWSAIGAPIVNTPGILNIPMTQSLSEIKLGYNYAPFQDQDIINVSTGQNGIHRPNDFNTATFAVGTDGTIYSLVSNLRWVTTANSSTLLTPEEAYGALIENKAETTVALPEDKKPFNWNEVFPESGVQGKNASINGFELVYIDNGPTQKQAIYTPSYLFRGKVKLNTGYIVDYVQIVPAQKQEDELATIQSSNDRRLQLRTFTPAPDQQLVGSPTAVPDGDPDPEQGPVPAKDCSEENAGPNIHLTYTLKINGQKVRLRSRGGWVYIAEKTNTVAEIENYRTLYHTALAHKFAWNHKYGEEPTSPYEGSAPSRQSGDMTGDSIYERVVSIYRKIIDGSIPLDERAGTQFNLRDKGMFQFLRSADYANDVCAVGATGYSPTIFLYSNTAGAFEVSPSYVLYSDPLLVDNTWKVTINNDGRMLEGDEVVSFLYYEFDPSKVKFTAQNEGYVINLKDLNSMGRKLADMMSLGNTETERLIYELSFAAKDLPKDTQFIKVSLVPIIELEKNLPLKVSPRPEIVNRYHFLLHKVSTNEKAKAPSIVSVKRGKSTLIEIGASVQ